MGVPQIPALLVLDTEALRLKDIRIEDIGWDDIEELGLGTRYVKREGIWCAEGSQNLGQAQCYELDAAYQFCSENGNEGMEITLYHLGFRDDPVRVRVIDVDYLYGRARQPKRDSGLTEPPPQNLAGPESEMYSEPRFREDIRGEMFTDRGFHGVTDYRFKDCCFEGPALRNTSGVVAVNCVFGGVVLHNSRLAFLEGDIYDLGNVKDSVVVVQFSDDIQRPRHRNKGSLVIIYSGHGPFGRDGNVISVPYHSIFGKERKRRNEAELARKLFRLEGVRRSDFPKWFLDRYWGKKLYMRGPDRRKAESLGKAQPPGSEGNGKEAEAAFLAALQEARKDEALPDRGPMKWGSYDDMRDDMLKFFGEENRRQLDMWRRTGDSEIQPHLMELSPLINRRLERMGYPVKGKERQYLEEMGRIRRAKKAIRANVPDKPTPRLSEAPPEEGDGSVKA